ncbi:MAG: hypothetical protein QF704_08570 [Anaerolineales bacterium]|nr:hypothetical protein [Anaerolineales bacterium]
MSLGAARAASTRAYQLLDTGTITSTGSQSYTIPAGTLYLEIEIWGAGGGGGAGGSQSGRSGTAYQAGGGGGGGAYCKHKYQPSDMQASDTLNFTVGAGGARDTSIGGMGGGTNGANTTLDTHKRSTTTITSFGVDANGGKGGLSGFAFSVGGLDGDGGTASGGSETNTSGEDGGARPSQSGSTHSGPDGGDGANGGAGGDGGVTSFSSDQYAGNGVVPGGGGGGGASSSEVYGGTGAKGKVIVKAYG